MDRRNQAIALTVLASFFWGTSFVAIGYGLRTAEPIGFLFLRFAIASVVSIIAVSVLYGGLVAYIKKKSVWFLGTINGLAFILQYFAQTTTGAGRTALLINMSVIFVAVTSYFVCREKFGLYKLTAVPLSFVGMVLLITGGDFSVISGGEFAGNLLGLTAGIIWSFFIVYSKMEIEKQNGENMLRFTTAIMIVSSIVIAVPFAIFGKLPAPDISIWLIVIYVAIFCTFLAYLFWIIGLETLTPTTSSTILLLETIFALMLSIWLLNEQFSSVSAVGGAVMLIAMVMITRAK